MSSTVSDGGNFIKYCYHSLQNQGTKNVSTGLSIYFKCHYSVLKHLHWGPWMGILTLHREVAFGTID